MTISKGLLAVKELCVNNKIIEKVDHILTLDAYILNEKWTIQEKYDKELRKQEQPQDEKCVL